MRCPRLWLVWVAQLTITSISILLSFFLIKRPTIIHNQISISPFNNFFLNNSTLQYFNLLNTINLWQLVVLVIFIITFLNPSSQLILPPLPCNSRMVIINASNTSDVTLSCIFNNFSCKLLSINQVLDLLYCFCLIVIHKVLFHQLHFLITEN